MSSCTKKARLRPVAGSPRLPERLL